MSPKPIVRVGSLVQSTAPGGKLYVVSNIYWKHDRTVNHRFTRETMSLVQVKGRSFWGWTRQLDVPTGMIQGKAYHVIKW